MIKLASEIVAGDVVREGSKSHKVRAVVPWCRSEDQESACQVGMVHWLIGGTTWCVDVGSDWVVI